MLADTLTITYNAVAVALKKTSEANYTSSYYAENGGRKFTLDVKHTLPKKGAPDESHVVKLTVEHFDANGLATRVVSPWVVIKTFDAPQDSAAALYAANALIGLMTSTFNADIIARQS
jgi:hypothetical protein